MALRDRPRRPAMLAVLLVAVLGCEDESGDADAGASEPVALDAEPELELPEGSPPTSLAVHDLIEGDGEPVTDGAVLTLHYLGSTWEGQRFASTWERGQPLSYEHGQGRWVAGWESGLEGMRAGGQRRIIVPPELGYGQRGAPGVPDGATLVFVVELVGVD